MVFLGSYTVWDIFIPTFQKNLLSLSLERLKFTSNSKFALARFRSFCFFPFYYLWFVKTFAIFLYSRHISFSSLQHPTQSNPVTLKIEATSSPKRRNQHPIRCRTIKMSLCDKRLSCELCSSLNTYYFPVPSCIILNCECYNSQPFGPHFNKYINFIRQTKS